MQSFEKCGGNIKGKTPSKILNSSEIFFHKKYSTELFSNGWQTNVKRKSFKEISQEALQPPCLVETKGRAVANFRALS